MGHTPLASDIVLCTFQVATTATFFGLPCLLGNCEKSLRSSRAFLGWHQQDQNKCLIVFAVFSCVKCMCLGWFISYMDTN